MTRRDAALEKLPFNLRSATKEDELQATSQLKHETRKPTTQAAPAAAYCAAPASSAPHSL